MEVTMVGKQQRLGDIPVFIIEWTLAWGKIVILPGERLDVTVRAPFSSIMYVVMLPVMATT